MVPRSGNAPFTTSIVFAAEQFGHGTMGLFDGRFEHRVGNRAGLATFCSRLPDRQEFGIFDV